MLFRIATRLGRSVEELEYGTACFRPLSYAEFIDWCGLLSIESKEEAGIDPRAQPTPDCPFTPDHPDYAAFMVMRGMGA